mmetsp:Transcript_9386/g.14236  ORF Transcript_9386/g.14236 Transcript_9386/m.14236 type:complete len:104 (+) Transcript_9386:160-471(+)
MIQHLKLGYLKKCFPPLPLLTIFPSGSPLALFFFSPIHLSLTMLMVPSLLSLFFSFPYLLSGILPSEADTFFSGKFENGPLLPLCDGHEEERGGRVSVVFWSD